MKRTRSPSPPTSSQRLKLSNEPETQAVSNKKGIKALEGIELHPLLSGNNSTNNSINRPNSTSSANHELTTTTTITSSVKENPFLAHWNSNANKKNKKFNERIPHVDRHLALEPSSHRSRPLKFNAPGKYMAKAEAERTAEQIRQLEREIAEATEDLGPELDVALIGDILRAEEDECKGLDFEWWDVPFLRYTSSSSRDKYTLAHDLLGNLIQRPSLGISSSVPESIKIYLTEEERKKLRRQRRLESQKEVQEKIALGLMAPPPAKVKLSSLPRMLAQPGNAMGDESVQTPTQIAASIRAQSAARQEAHQQSNTDRKLSQEERSMKKFKKFAELDAEQVHLAVFKLDDRLEDGSKRFKVLINAEQNHLHGRSLTTPNFTLIIVEGGPKGIKRYTRLLQERMTPPANLLWTGTQLTKSEKLTASGAGKPFQMKIVEKNFEAVEYLDRWGYKQFWSLASSKEEDN